MAVTTVRPADPAEADAILDLHAASIRAFGPAAYDEAQVEGWARREEPDYPIGEEGHRFVVAERRDELAGFGHLDAAGAEIAAVYVHPDHAREGVGSAILAALEATAREHGVDELDLLASKNAVPFYGAAGYERVETECHETCGEELECVHMRKGL